MNKPEPRIRVTVDPTNPGQFFACCGLLELADRLWPGAEGWFDDEGFCIESGKSLLDLLSILIMDPPTEVTRLECNGLKVRAYASILHRKR
jgi:CRISPR-associated protein Csx14